MRQRRQKIYSYQEASEIRVNLQLCIVGFWGNFNAVNGTEHYWVPLGFSPGKDWRA